MRHVVGAKRGLPKGGSSVKRFFSFISRQKFLGRATSLTVQHNWTTALRIQTVRLKLCADARDGGAFPLPRKEARCGKEARFPTRRAYGKGSSGGRLRPRRCEPHKARPLTPRTRPPFSPSGGERRRYANRYLRWRDSLEQPAKRHTTSPSSLPPNRLTQPTSCPCFRASPTRTNSTKSSKTAW